MPSDKPVTAPPDVPAAARSSRRRLALLMVVTGLALAGVVARLAHLQLNRNDHYRALRERQTRGVIVHEQPRMKIVFRTGELAAQSVAAESVFVEPQRVSDKAETARQIGQALGRTPAEVLPLLDEWVAGDPPKPCRFRWVGRRVPTETAARIRALRIPGVGIIPEYRRQYPSAAVASQVLGGVNVDGEGIDGVELAMDAMLKGGRESERVVSDARRRTIAVSTDLPRIAADGAALVLSIHRGVQWIVEEELDRLEEEHHPAWACAIALDPATGDVLGMSSRPTFDANDFGRAAPDARRNRCITDSYEPGSTFKTFVLAACLEEGLAGLDDTVFCENGAWTVDGRTVHDHHPYGMLSVQDVIAKSSNVGAVKLGLQYIASRGIPSFQRRLADFGFGSETNSLLPGESGGRLASPARWSKYTSTSVPYGYEVAVTPLQLARAYAVFANGGYAVEPRIIRGIVDAGGRILWTPPVAMPRRILRRETVEDVKHALTTVVESGTATAARLPGYTVAGKTGTTKLYNPATRRYDSGHIASFVAFAPVESARLCVLVVVDRPSTGEYYGGKVAGPVVRRILDRGLRLLEVPPRAELTAKAPDAERKADD